MALIARLEVDCDLFGLGWIFYFMSASASSIGSLLCKLLGSVFLVTSRGEVALIGLIYGGSLSTEKMEELVPNA
jgi:hypothetical protein